MEEAKEEPGTSTGPVFPVGVLKGFSAVIIPPTRGGSKDLNISVILYEITLFSPHNINARENQD